MKKIRYSEITSEKIYNNRRSFIKSIGLGAGSIAMTSIPFANNESAWLKGNPILHEKN